MPDDKPVLIYDANFELQVIRVVSEYLRDNHYLQRDLTYDDVDRLKNIMRESVSAMILNHENTCDNNKKQKPNVLSKTREWLSVVLMGMTLVGMLYGYFTWFYKVNQKITELTAPSATKSKP
jgi:hypothetical protein